MGRARRPVPRGVTRKGAQWKVPHGGNGGGLRENCQYHCQECGGGSAGAVPWGIGSRGWLVPWWGWGEGTGRTTEGRGQEGSLPSLWRPGGYLGDASDRDGDPMAGVDLLALHVEGQRVQGDPARVEAGGRQRRDCPIPGTPPPTRDQFNGSFQFSTPPTKSMGSRPPPPEVPLPGTRLWICCMQGRTKTRPPATITGGLRQKPAAKGAKG